MRKISQRFGGLLILALLLLWSPTVAPAQLRLIAPESQQAADPIDGYLRRAQPLETDGRWGEALSVYEEALREYPDEPALGDRHTLAKIHYDLGRRYSDSSFLRALQTLPDRQAMSLYSEVLTKIESHYVTAPDWSALIARGNQGLQVALGEKAFQRKNLPGRTTAEIDAFIAELRREQNQAIRSRQQAIDALSAVARQAYDRLRLTTATVAFEYACGAIGALDSYSSYLTSDQLNDVYSQIEGNFVGLGIELKAQNKALQIVKVITGSPAERAGIHAGDQITEVDGKPTADLTTDQAADLLQGTEGSIVAIVIRTRDDVVRRMSIRRQHVEVPSVDDVKMLDKNYGVGYLKLTCFQKTTSRDLDAALWKLYREGMKRLIIDLRGNPGGLLTSSVEVADKFIDEGTIVSTRGRNALEDYNYTAHRAGTWNVPLVVLIDGDSASASEIFAGAIRDHRRGSIIGQRSYGKGSVQGIFPLALAGSGVRLTTAKFYSPKGHPISNVGVQPDVKVHTSARPADGQVGGGAKTDHVLDTGLQEARQLTAKRSR